MEFLYRLYSYNYFGIGLFIVITVLAFSFLVILFFGKKDEKTREIENAKQVESEILANVVTDNSIDKNEELKVESIDTISSPVEEPILESVKEEIDIPESINVMESTESEEEIDPFATRPIALDDFDVTEELSKTAPMDIIEPQEPSYDTDVFNFEFDSNSVNSEYNREDYRTEEPKIDDFDLEQFNVPVEEPVYEKREEPSYTAPETNRVEETVEQKRTPMPSVFSSVYLNNEKPTDVLQEEPKVEMTRSEYREEMPTPTKPAFDLPKKIELPKRSSTSENTNIINSMSTENNRTNLNTILNNAEEDSYTIK